MRRSGTPASFHGLMRPSIPVAQSTVDPRHVPRPGPLSLPTPANFDFAPAQSSAVKDQVISPASSSNSSFSSAPSSIDNFQLSAEVRQSLNRSAPEASGGKSSLSGAPDPAVAPEKFIPRFGPAHRMPPESDVGEDSISVASSQAVMHTPDQPQSFGERLSQAQEKSQVWNYIKDKLVLTYITCRSERERGALLEILQLPKQNDLDDKPMRGTDRHKRRYDVIIGSILQVVGVKGYCDACSGRPHRRIHWEHRKKTCIGLPPDTTGPEYRNLVEFVAGRCSNCIRSCYSESSCNFAAGDEPADAEERGGAGAAAGHHGLPSDAEDAEVDDMLADPIHARLSSQNQETARGNTRQPTQVRPPQTQANGAEKDRPPSTGSKTHAGTSTGLEESELVIRDAIMVGLRASTQLAREEQQEFHNWMAALFSFSSVSPDLEAQALAALMRLRQLPPDSQTDIRRRILQMLPGAMGRPE